MRAKTKTYKGDVKGDADTPFLSDRVDGEEYTIETPNGTCRSTGGIKKGHLYGGWDYPAILGEDFGGNRGGE